MKCKDCEHFDEELSIPCKVKSYHELEHTYCLLLHIVWLLRAFEIDREKETEDDNWWKEPKE